MHVRDRIQEFRRVKAGDLRPHPRNWRTHPELQKNALRGLLAEIGYADALLARPLKDGSLELIDGHLRAETTPEQEVPVLVVDLDDAEAAKLLAMHDPLVGLAGTDGNVLAELLATVESDSDAVREMLDHLIPSDDPAPEIASPDAAPEVPIPEAFQVIVECADESQQKDLFEQLTAQGYACRLLNL